MGARNRENSYDNSEEELNQFEEMPMKADDRES